MAVRVARRLVIVGALLIGILTPSAAAAAPSAPPTPTAITITGPGVVESLVVRADDDPELFAALLSQVNWMSGRGQAPPPEAGTLGPKYTVVVHIDDVPRHSYDLYPLAAGGPRAFRPADQPRHTTNAAWFYGRLTMSEVLRTAGVPLPPQTDSVPTELILLTSRQRMIEEPADTAAEIEQIFVTLRRAMLLHAAVVMIIALGLVATSVLLYRQER